MSHDLVIVLKGFTDPGAVRAEVARRVPAAQFHEIDDTGFDITAYRSAAQALDHDVLCFLNSHSRVEAPNWLRLMVDGLQDQSVGAIGATGSWEVMNGSTPFPNVHLRTNGFALARPDFLSLDFGPLATKRDCNWFEAGPNSLTRQVLASGQTVCVVGRQGNAAPPEEWAAMPVFRTGSQSELLISDNRTRAYEAATNRKRKRLASLAWGAQAAPALRPWLADLGIRLGL